MQKSINRRVLGVVSVVLATQLLSACVVLPVPARRARAVVIEPGYGPGYGHHHHHRDRERDWRR
jgi:hypothetical protein